MAARRSEVRRKTTMSVLDDYLGDSRLSLLEKTLIQAQAMRRRAGGPSCCGASACPISRHVA
jgi:hypothetical protein